MVEVAFVLDFACVELSVDLNMWVVVALDLDRVCSNSMVMFVTCMLGPTAIPPRWRRHTSTR